MAKRVKKRSSVRTKVVTKTRRVYVGARKKARKLRAAAGERMSTGDIVLAVAGAGVGSIGGSIVLSKMPAAVPDIAKNGILAGIGGFCAYKGLKKKNKLLLGLGMGAAAAAATNIIGGIVSGNSTTVSAPYARLAAPYARLNGIPNASLCAPMAAPYDGEEC
jgi:hypothetical protein